MLLTLDVGNTNTVLGVFRGKELIANWRLSTARDQTIDEYGILTRDLFTLAKLEPRRNRRSHYQFGGSTAQLLRWPEWLRGISIRRRCSSSRA